MQNSNITTINPTIISNNTNDPSINTSVSITTNPSNSTCSTIDSTIGTITSTPSTSTHCTTVVHGTLGTMCT